MSVSRRSDGRWLVKYKDEEGRWKQRSFKSEDEARRFEQELEYDTADNSRLTVLECVLAYLKNKKVCPQTVVQYRYIVCGTDRKDGRHTEGPAEMLASRYIDTLNRRDLEAMREFCRSKNMCASTINRHTGLLQTAFNWAAEQDLLEKNPWAKYRRLEAETHHHDGTLEELQKVYAELPAWMQWACRTALALCLRPGVVELFSLRWQAFNWRHNCVTVRMGKVKSNKTVFPPAEYLEEALERFVADGKDASLLVCRGRTGKQVTAACYDMCWRRACRRAGVSIPMYAIRHIAASEMLAAGADLAAVAAQLGHKDLTTTGRYYAHALPAAQRHAAQALGCTKLGAAIEENAGKNK